MAEHRPDRRELLALAGILVVAALTRLPGLAARGRWNADQGDQMLAIHDFVTNGVVPLTGPLSSTGGFHHGALFYWLMAPAALVSGSDPFIVALWLVVLGLAAVAATWWLGRLTGGPLAAVFAGILAAVSSSGIESSTVIWNPDPIALFAALAAGGTVMAHRTGRARWWLLAGVGAMGAMQLHLLGIVFAVPVAGAWLVDAVRAGADDRSRRPILLGGLGAALIVAAGFMPMLVHDAGSGFKETGAILAYLAGPLAGAGAAGTAGTGGGVPPLGSDIAAPVRVLVVGLRTLTWPISGLFVVNPVVALAVAGFVVALLVGAWGVPRPWAARWQIVAIAWSVVALALAVPGLATVTQQLPNDHYHAFLDPLILALAGTGLARAWGLGPVARGATARRAIAGVGLVALVGASVTGWPSFPAYDGGFPEADAAAARIEKLLDGRSPALVEIPPFKTAQGIEFPLVRRGIAINGRVRDASVIVIECDPLFDRVMGATCGGDAERAWQAANGLTSLRILDRFANGPRRWITVYEQDLPALVR